MSDQPNQSLYGGEPAPSGGGQPKPLGLMDILSGLFSEPVALFKRLAAEPRWVGALIAYIALSLALSIVWALRVDALEFAYMALDSASQRLGSLSAAQIDQMAEMQAKFLPVGTVFGSLIATPAVIFLSGLVFWAVGLISKEGPQWKPTYPHGLVVATIPGLAAAPYFLLGAIMALINPVGTLRPDQLSPSSLSFWLETDSSKLSALYSSIDLFLLISYVMVFLAAKYALRAKTWGAALCVFLALAAPLLRILFA